MVKRANYYKGRRFRDTKAEARARKKFWDHISKVALWLLATIGVIATWNTFGPHLH